MATAPTAQAASRDNASSNTTPSIYNEQRLWIHLYYDLIYCAMRRRLSVITFLHDGVVHSRFAKMYPAANEQEEPTPGDRISTLEEFVNLRDELVGERLEWIETNRTDRIRAAERCDQVDWFKISMAMLRTYAAHRSVDSLDGPLPDPDLNAALWAYLDTIVSRQISRLNKSVVITPRCSHRTTGGDRCTSIGPVSASEDPSWRCSQHRAPDKGSKRRGKSADNNAGADDDSGGDSDDDDNAGGNGAAIHKEVVLGDADLTASVNGLPQINVTEDDDVASIAASGSGSLLPNANPTKAKTGKIPEKPPPNVPFNSKYLQTEKPGVNEKFSVEKNPPGQKANVRYSDPRDPIPPADKDNRPITGTLGWTTPNGVWDPSGVIRIYELGTNKYLKHVVVINELSKLDLRSPQAREVPAKRYNQVIRRNCDLSREMPHWSTAEYNILFDELNKVIKAHAEGILGLASMRSFNWQNVTDRIDRMFEERGKVPPERSKESVRAQWTKKTHPKIRALRKDIDDLKEWKKDPANKNRTHPKMKKLIELDYDEKEERYKKEKKKEKEKEKEDEKEDDDEKEKPLPKKGKGKKKRGVADTVTVEVEQGEGAATLQGVVSLRGRKAAQQDAAVEEEQSSDDQNDDQDSDQDDDQNSDQGDDQNSDQDDDQNNDQDSDDQDSDDQGGDDQDIDDQVIDDQDSDE
ncbi:hypothetical protein IQ07DRAFT_628939 [Pyrenochaeta sp. DS3sAY3a]|nr:hypothetical protein IQ07DRAFT_628939 [Pyrenochaeta sp. DS3sAY3a]